MVNKNRTIRNISDLKSFADDTISNSDFKLNKINISDQSEWKYTNGALTHISGGFFSIVGMENTNTHQQELMYYQPQSALTGLIIHYDGNDLNVLLQARIEPGNTNICQYGPTIQSTSANYMRLHGGHETSYVELFRNFHPEVIPLGNSLQFDIGKRYFHKNKVHSYVETQKQINTHHTMAWVPISIIKEALNYNNLINTDLRSLIGIFDWDYYIDGKNSKNNLVDSVSKFYPNDYINQIGKSNWKFIKLNDLNDWTINDSGINNIGNTGRWVDMYNVSSNSREVTNWQQPLLQASSQGMILLFLRESNNSYEFLISFKSEFGISGGLAALPSELVYPGNNSDINLNNQSSAIETIAEVVQSEEGGRFYKNENLYRVLLVEENIEIKSFQRWVSIEELKAILSSSCKASIQLRCISSLILDILNPKTFG